MLCSYFLHEMSHNTGRTRIYYYSYYHEATHCYVDCMTSYVRAIQDEQSCRMASEPRSVRQLIRSAIVYNLSKRNRTTDIVKSISFRSNKIIVLNYIEFQFILNHHTIDTDIFIFPIILDIDLFRRRFRCILPKMLPL